MDVTNNPGPVRVWSSSTSSGSGDLVTHADQQRLVSSTVQSFVWNVSDQIMNFSHHPEDYFSSETSQTESINESRWSGFTSHYLTTSEETQDDLTTTSRAAATTHAVADGPSIRIMVYTVVHAVVILIGLLTNAFTLLVMTRSATRTQRMAVFLIPLALFDVIKLISDIHLAGLIQLIPNAFDIFTHSDLTCHIASCVAFASSCISSWMLVVMTAERAIAVFDPIRFKKHWSKNVSIVLVITPILVIGMLSVVSFWISEIQTDPITGILICGLKKQGTLLLAAAIIDALVYSIVPSIILCILNALIIKGMRAAVLPIVQQERVVTVTVLSVSIFFLISVLPFGIYEIYYMTPNADRINHFWFEITLLSSLNHSLTFFFYIVCGKRFRKEYVNMMCCLCYKIQATRNSQ